MIRARILLTLVYAGIFTLGHRASLAEESEAVAVIGEYQLRESSIAWLLGRREMKGIAGAEKLALRRAAAHSLVKRHLALAALLDSGGQSMKDHAERTVGDWKRQMQASGESLESFARRNGTQTDVLIAEIRWQTVWNSYIKSKLVDANLRRFFERNPSRYDGTRIDISQIYLPEASQREWLEQISEKISRGEISFSEAAKKYSKAGSAETGGRVGPVRAIGDINPAVAEAVFSSRKEGLLPVIPSSRGLHLVYIHERQPGHGSFDELDTLSEVRRDAADFLFDYLAGEQAKKTPVRWLDESLGQGFLETSP